jgi:hypothetical protein
LRQTGQNAGNGDCFRLRNVEFFGRMHEQMNH